MVGLASPKHQAATTPATSQRRRVPSGAAGGATTAPHTSVGKVIHAEWTARAARRQSRTSPHWTEGRLSAATSLPVHRCARTKHMQTQSHTHVTQTHLIHANTCMLTFSHTLINTSMQLHTHPLTHVHNSPPHSLCTHSHMHTHTHLHPALLTRTHVHTLLTSTQGSAHACTHMFVRTHLCLHSYSCRPTAPGTAEVASGWSPRSPPSRPWCW